MGEHMKSVMESIQFINTHLDDDLSPERLAFEAGYSMFHFCRIFKEVTGESVMRFVRGKRLKAAYEEMQSGGDMDEVAARCGYETTSGFSRAYQKQFGYRPQRKVKQ